MEFAQPEYASIKDNKKLPRGIPGSYGLPFIGKTLSFVVDPYKVLHQQYTRYGPVSRISLTLQKFVLALGPDYIQQLMLDRDQSFSARMGYDAPLGDFFAGGLLVRDFAEHKFHRRIMQTAFKTDAMRTYVEKMHPIIDEQVDAWRDQDNFHFYPNIKTLLLDIGARVFLGMDLGGAKTASLNQSFLQMNDAMLAMVRKDWPGLLYHRGMNARRELENFFINLVPARRGVSGNDMATFFANEKDDEGAYFSEQVVGEHLIFLLLAAHDTTTSALTMSAYYMAHDQQWQERLREGLVGLQKPHLAYEDLGTAVQDLEHSFHESMRLNPPVPSMMRRTTKEVELGGFTLPPHTMVQVSPLYTMRMQEWWSNPSVFDPERFARQEHKQHSFLWAPFGGGAHKCIGLHFADMLYKCVLSRILLKYRFRFAKAGQFEGKIQHFPFAKPMDNLPLVLESLD